MPTDVEYRTRIRRLSWPGLQRLWGDITTRSVDRWWPAGKAFEYLVLRMFDLDGGAVRWPYGVSLLGEEEVEQIDGSVQVGSLYCLVESKDEAGNLGIGPISKIRNQLLRRPAGTIGLVFSSHAFTDPAILLTHFAMPQAILLWSGDEVQRALEERHISRFLLEKFRVCVDQGMPDWNISAL